MLKRGELQNEKQIFKIYVRVVTNSHSHLLTRLHLRRLMRRRLERFPSAHLLTEGNLMN